MSASATLWLVRAMAPPTIEEVNLPSVVPRFTNRRATGAAALSIAPAPAPMPSSIRSETSDVAVVARGVACVLDALTIRFIPMCTAWDF